MPSITIDERRLKWKEVIRVRIRQGRDYKFFSITFTDRKSMDTWLKKYHDKLFDFDFLEDWKLNLYIMMCEKKIAEYDGIVRPKMRYY